MKIFALIILFSHVTSAFTQTTRSSYADSSDMLPVVISYKTHGYVDGVRLDCVNNIMQKLVERNRRY